jgi:hypothetical protein
VRQGQALFNLSLLTHFRNNDSSLGIRFLIYTARTSIPAVYSAVAKFLVPDWEDIVDSGIVLSYRPARLHHLYIPSIFFSTVIGGQSLCTYQCILLSTVFQSGGQKEMSSILADQMSPNAGGGKKVTGSQPVSTAVNMEPKQCLEI